MALTMVTQGDHLEERRLVDEGIDSWSPVAAAGVNQTLRVQFADGSVGYHKSFSGLDNRVAAAYGQADVWQPIHEVAAWRLARTLGPPWSQMVAPTVLRSVDGELGSISREVPGGPGPIRREDIVSAGFFDALVGQQDRHAGNFYSDRDQAQLFDHGFTFTAGGHINNNVFVWARSLVAPHLRSEEVDALKRLLSSPSLGGLRGIIEDARLTALQTRATQMLATGLFTSQAEIDQFRQIPTWLQDQILQGLRT